MLPNLAVNKLFDYLVINIVKLNFYWTGKMPKTDFFLYVPVENQLIIFWYELCYQFKHVSNFYFSLGIY